MEVDNVHSLDRALSRARHAFHREEGTVHWDIYDLGEPGERTLVEIFADREAVARHDDSAAVASLLADLEGLRVDVLSAVEYTQLENTATENKQGELA
ncbi:putative quinol monooxygenase [Microbacterium sp. E-13]|uniref:putative quinol monooxygenase n=1 Tax=Microbacterium sp. E-13 TaxID=3404048 RepID=UPI003CF12110